MANSLGRFNFHKKKLVKILKFQKWINRILNNRWDKHKAICDSILAEWKSEERCSMAEIEKIIEDLESIKRTLYNLTGSHRNERKVDNAIQTIRELQSKSEEVCEWKKASEDDMSVWTYYPECEGMTDVDVNTVVRKLRWWNNGRY